MQYPLRAIIFGVIICPKKELYLTFKGLLSMMVLEFAPQFFSKAVPSDAYGAIIPNHGFCSHNYYIKNINAQAA